MFSIVLFSGVREVGSIESQLELEACRVLIQAGRPSTVPVSEVASLKEIYNPPSKIRPGGTEAQQGYSIA